MPLTYLIDEHLRGTLAVVVIRIALRYGRNVDILEVGQVSASPLGTKDPPLLIWTEREDRILVSLDRNSLISHLSAHRGAGSHCPRISIVQKLVTVKVAEQLVLLAFASEPGEWRDRIEFLP